MYEFFSPFAHVEGRYEWCRIRSPTHGVFDTMILLAERPCTVYVGAENGLRFMRDRFPECVSLPARIKIRESAGGTTVKGALKADAGPLKSATMTLQATPGQAPRHVPYGGKGEGIWGSPRFTCWGVDLVVDGRADGKLVWRDREATRLANEPALITLGSFGRIAPMTANPTTVANGHVRKAAVKHVKQS